MTHDLGHTEPRDERPVLETRRTVTPPSGDPSLELFGNGWRPTEAPPSDPDSYTGRHRAPEV